MSKAVLKFDLPEEQYEFEDAVKGSQWKFAMGELDEWLRSEMKYDNTKGDIELNVLDEVRTFLHKILEERNLSLD